MKTKEELINDIESAEASLNRAKEALSEWESYVGNNVFESVEAASIALEERFRNQAFEECEGAYNCGSEEYEQEFIVGGKHYIFKLTCEYNRYDKTYYYLERSEVSIEEKFNQVDNT